MRFLLFFIIAPKYQFYIFYTSLLNFSCKKETVVSFSLEKDKLIVSRVSRYNIFNKSRGLENMDKSKISEDSRSLCVFKFSVF